MNAPPYGPQGGGWPGAPSPSADMDMGLEPLEPQTRARSNTWPLPRPEGYADPPPPPAEGQGAQPTAAAAAAAPLPAPKKNSSRRNAWGNLSYADLITQAITTSPDKRLTLSQIYEWMVQNVPYFKDKGDSNSSAGWKNSIRHNLSLHNRFMRVQNEGTGKSSWWMINPDAKPGKSVRRRAVTMEPSKFEKRRGRVKKKVEMIRNGLPDTTPSPTSSVSEGLDLFPEDSPLQHSGGSYHQLSPEFRPRASSNPSVFSGGNTFQLSPDFRARANSNTSSCGGRLSPIPSAPAGAEGEWSGGGGRYGGGGPGAGGYSPPDLGGGGGGGGPSQFSPDELAGNLESGMKLQPDYMGLMMNGQTTQSQPPPPYSSPFETFRDFGSMHTSSYNSCPVHRGMQSCNCMRQIKVERMSPTGMSPPYAHSEPSPDPLAGQYMGGPMSVPRPPSSSPPLTPQPQQIMPSTMMGQFIGALNSSSITDDLNINVDSIQGGFDCNVEELIKHELTMEGSLDFNFGSQQAAASAAAAAAAAAAQQQAAAGGQPMGAPPPYGAVSAAVTAPSYVH